MTAVTAINLPPWTPVPDAVWFALREILNPYVSARFTIPGDPVPKERPRLGMHGNTRTPAKTLAAEKVVNAAFHAAVPGWEPEPDWTFGGLFEFRTSSGSLVDLDNTQKLVMDALNTTTKKRQQTGLWLDDIQAGQAHLRIVRGRAEPETEVLLFRVADNGTRPTKLCECGTRFRGREKRCSPCRKRNATVNALLALDAPDASEQLGVDKRRVFRHIVATQLGYNTSPSTGQTAQTLDLSEHRVRVVVAALIADGNLAREGRKLRVLKSLGATR